MQRFEELKNYLHSNFVELDHAIRALLLGLTAKAHVFLLGPPGTAKSHLGRGTLRYSGAEIFPVPFYR